MSRTIEFSRNLKLQWLDETVLLVKAGKTEDEMREALNDYLSCEIKSKINIRKTRELLMNLWVYPNELVSLLRHTMLQNYEPYTNDSLAFHWCMMLLRYPVFVDVCSLIGRLHKVQDTFSVAWLKEVMIEEWGERATLLDAIAKILQTMRDFGVIETLGRGEYKIKQKSIDNELTIEVLTKTILMLNRKPYHGLVDLLDNHLMFPFVYTVNHELIHKFDGLTLEQFNGGITISIQEI